MTNDLSNVTQPADVILLRLVLFYYCNAIWEKNENVDFFNLYMDNFTFRNSVFTLPE